MLLRLFLHFKSLIYRNTKNTGDIVISHKKTNADLGEINNNKEEKIMKKQLSFLMAAALLCRMTGCSEKPSEPTKTAEDIAVTQTMYKEESVDFPSDFLYTEGLTYVEGTGVRLYYMNKDNKYCYADYDENMEVSATNELYSAENIKNMIIDGKADGSSAAWVEFIESDGEIGSEEYFENAVVTYEIHKFAPDGTETDVIIPEIGQYIAYPDDFVMGFDDIGGQYIVTASSGRFLLDDSGNVTEASDDWSTMHYGTDSDGKLIAGGMKGYTYLDGATVDIPDDSLTEYGNYLSMQQGIEPGHDGFKAFFMLNTGIFGLNESGNLTQVVNYSDSLIQSAEYYNIVYAGEGKFAGFGARNDHVGFSVMTVRPEGYVMDRKEFTIGAVWDYDTIAGMATYYNKKSDKYIANVKQYDNEIDSIRADILAGDPPDIFFYPDPEMMYKLINIGSAENMYELSEKYGGFKKEDILDNIADAFEYKGGLYRMAMTFKLTMNYGSSKVFDKGLMTVDEFSQAVENMPEGMYIGNAFQYNDPVGAFRELCESGINNWVDFDNAKCNFDSPEFIKLMETIKNAEYAPEINIDEYLKLGEDERQMISDEEQHRLKNGTALLYQSYMYGYSDIAFMRKEVFLLDDGDYVIFFPPGNDPKGTVLANQLAFSILNGGENIEGAWDFANYILSDDFLLSYFNISDDFFTMKSAFDKKTEDAQYWSNPNTINPNGTQTYHGAYGSTPLTDEVIAEFRELVDNSTVLAGEFTDISAIMEDEFTEYAAGEISAETCAERIQNRVSIYLSENS